MLAQSPEPGAHVWWPRIQLPLFLKLFTWEAWADRVEISVEFHLHYTAIKILHPFFLQLSKVEVINTYHAKFYIEIPKGRPVILNAMFSFAVPPLLERQMAVNHMESWI